MPCEVKVNSVLRKGVLQVLEYYALFNWPLTLQEIHARCPVKCSIHEVDEVLQEFSHDGLVSEIQSFYSVQESPDILVKRRTQGEEAARVQLRKAKWAGRFISLFPFVRFVGISGSLSKGFADKHTDFDFFIVTAANRLWVCRSILHIFKKFTILLNMQHHFCMNYFIDEQFPEIEEHNYFTVIELTSMVPVCGTAHYNNLMKHNNWASSYLPNTTIPYLSKRDRQWLARAMRFLPELVLNLAGNALNLALMRFTDRRWRKKWGRRNFPPEEYDLAFKTTPYHSKNHPDNHQKKVLNRLREIVHD